MNQQMPFMPIPIFNYGAGQQQSQFQESVIPGRVKLAVQFLQDLSHKTMDRAAVNDLSIEVIQGQKLKCPEENAQSAACNMLIAYFRGELEPDKYDHKTRENQSPGTILRCFICGGKGAVSSVPCELCKTSGTILVYPGNCPDVETKT